MRKFLKISVIAFIFFVIFIGVAWWPAKWYLAEKYGIEYNEVLHDLLMQRLGLRKRSPDRQFVEVEHVNPENLAKVNLEESIQPFREIGDRLGNRAKGNNIVSMRGATIFDANGDGRLDLFFPLPQRTIPTQVTSNNVLTDKKVPAKPNALYLNQGNDAEGNPIFTSIQDLLAKGNQEQIREELLIEGKYKPRDDISEDEFGVGRIAWGAISADFNGDGRLDLYVLNAHYGLFYQTKELGFPIYPSPENLGRAAHIKPLELLMPSFLGAPLEDGVKKIMVEFGHKPELEGRNTLYINLGDRDQDGIPEWEDITEKAEVGGHWATVSAAVADYDRDGDLDLYIVNFQDPDFWGFGTPRFSGQRNQLYKNQLAETGELRFVDVAVELKVSGLHEEENLATSVYFSHEDKEIPISEHIVDGKPVGEKADHSWSAIFSDWNHDNWLDLVVANDVGNRLRVYENLKGKGFRYMEEFNDHLWEGSWMGMSGGDLDGDGKEEIFLTNCGSQVMAVRNNQLLLQDSSQAGMLGLGVINYAQGRNTLHHEILQYTQDNGFQRMGTQVLIHHSPYIAPDQTRPENFARHHLEVYEKNNFATSLAGIEFAWNAAMFDVDNDGDLDLYLAGSLLRGNDNFLGDWSGSPGRMLVNESKPGEFTFRDHTLEYRLLDMTDVDYDSNPPRRPAPGTGWHKRDVIYITDMDSYSGMGLDASKSKVHDIFRMHEAAVGILAADLNGDGLEDLVVTHNGGYNSVSPKARNLKVNFAGRALAVPAPNKVLKPPTNFEEGPTFVYINGGVPTGEEGHWVKLRLQDKDSYNVYGVGARITVNEKIVRRVRTTQGAVASSKFGDLHVGLGADSLRSVEIIWPSGDTSPQQITFKEPVEEEIVCIDREIGTIPCDSTLFSQRAEVQPFEPEP